MHSYMTAPLYPKLQHHYALTDKVTVHNSI